MNINECALFKNTRIDLSTIKTKTYQDNKTIALEGDISKNLGIVLEGKIHVKAYSLGGKNFTMNVLKPGQLFGDVLMFASEINTFPGSLITQGKTTVAYIPNADFFNYLKNDFDLLQNFLTMFSKKAYELNFKSKLLSQDSVRDKILFYLYQEKRLQKSNIIELKMSKEELANLLFMQRPSLSRELIKMKQDGLIDYDRWTITIYEDI
jgi:CRP-like cAMP-binding protein